MATPTPPRLIGITEAIDLATRRLHNAGRVVPSVLDSINERRANVTTRSNNETGISARGHSDRTAAIASELAHLAHQRQDIANACRLILRCIDHLDDICRATLGRREINEDPPSCVGYPVGKDCYDSPGYDIQHGRPVTRSNRLCDGCELERQRDERAAQKAASARRVTRTSKVPA